MCRERTVLVRWACKVSPRKLPPCSVAVLLAAVMLTACASSAKRLSTQVETCQRRASALEHLAASDAPRALAADRAEQRRIERRLAEYDDLARTLDLAFNEQGIAATLRDERLVVALPMPTLFDRGAATLNAQGDETVQQLAAVLRDVTEHDIVVVSHADEPGEDETGAGQPAAADPTGAGAGAGLGLALRRALELAGTLSELGVDPGRLAAASGGADGRGTQIIIMPRGDEIPAVPRRPLALSSSR